MEYETKISARASGLFFCHFFYDLLEISGDAFEVFVPGPSFDLGREFWFGGQSGFEEFQRPLFVGMFWSPAPVLFLVAVFRSVSVGQVKAGGAVFGEKGEELLRAAD